MSVDDITALPTEQLERHVCEYAANIAAATCQWLLLVAELDRREAWRSWGAYSCAHWLSWHCGIALPTGREQVRVARALESLPAITEAFGAGQLSYAKTRALSRIATPEAEGELVELARNATAAQLEIMVRAFRRATAPDLDDANARHDRRYLRHHLDDDGSLVINARIPPEAAGPVLAALTQAMDALREGVSAEASRLAKPSPTQLAADALVAIAASALRHQFAAGPESDQTMVSIVISEGLLHDDDPDGLCEISGVGAIAREAGRRLLCDASVVPVFETLDGTPADAGRKRRTCSRRQRRALLARNKTCIFPSCTHSRFVEVHHIVHWADGGPTVLSNLAPLCWFHHRLLHEGGFTMEALPDGAIVFRKPNGDLVAASPVTTTSDVREHHASPDAPVARCHGERYDLGLAVDVLIGLLHRPSHRSAPGVSAETRERISVTARREW
jgi:hypothetical protein